MKDWNKKYIKSIIQNANLKRRFASSKEEYQYWNDYLCSLNDIIDFHYNEETCSQKEKVDYYSIIKDDFSYLNMYKELIPYIASFYNQIEGFEIKNAPSLSIMDKKRVSPFKICRSFYSQISSSYSQLYSHIAKKFSNTMAVTSLRNTASPFGYTFPVYGSTLSFSAVGFNQTLQDYFTTIHECSHSISTLLNPYTLFELNKFCFSEVDSLFFELLATDFLEKKGFSKAEIYSILLETLRDILYSCTLIYDKIFMYQNLSKTELQNKRKVITYLKDELGYDRQGIQDVLYSAIKEELHYVISYICASEYYVKFQTEQEQTVRNLIAFIKKQNLTISGYFGILKTLDIIPGAHFKEFIDIVARKEKEVYGTTKLLYRP